MQVTSEDCEALMRKLRQQCSFDELLILCIASDDPPRTVCESQGWDYFDFADEYQRKHA